MPMIDADGCPINVEVAGSDSAPVLMLSNSLGTNLHMWDDQMAEWTKHFRVVRYDRRGHGKSGAPKGPYSMERLGRDVLAVVDGLKIKKFNWCGLSMGGMVGQWLGANAPERIEKLILSNTHFNYPDKGPWNDRIKFVQEKGVMALFEPSMERWFTKGFRENAPQAMAHMKEMFVTNNPVIVGSQDPATPPAAGEAIAKQIKGAKLVAIDAAHIANIEQPKIYAETVLNFLKS